MPPVAYRNPMLVVLTILVVFNHVDRIIFGLLLQDIKIDLQLTDTELGFLSGIAFALFYSVMGIPIARWADRGNRVAIISVTAVLWSAAAVLCGTAKSFGQLMLVRIGVAVGEAGCIPPSLSLIADYFNRAERPRAMAIYGLGSCIGGVVGYFVGGWLNESYGWRMTFVLLGAPGLFLAALTWLTVKEPRRTGPALQKLPAVQPSMREVGKTLWRIATFRQLLLCVAVMYFFNYGILQWLPTFLIRSYSLTTGEVGSWLALLYGLGGIAGAYVGGYLASRYAPNNERLQLRATMLAIMVAAVLSVCVYLSENYRLTILLMGLVTFFLSTINGPLLATIQTLVPESMRAGAFALVYLFANLIGMGFGPLATGFLSDAFRPWAGEESLRYALAALAPGYLWCAWYAWRASMTVTRDLAAASADPVAVSS